MRPIKFIFALLLTLAVAMGQTTPPATTAGDLAAVLESVPGIPKEIPAAIETLSSSTVFSNLPKTPMVTCPSRWAIGASYEAYGSPKTTGFIANASLLPFVACDPTKAQPYLYSQVIVTPKKVGNQWSLTDTTTTGLAYPALQFKIGSKKVQFWLLGTAGVSVTGTNAGLGYTYGAMLSLPIFNGTSELLPAFEWINQKPVILLGWLF